MPERARGDRSGFALIGVLWLVVLVSVVGLEFSLQARAVSRRVANAAEFSRARAAAVGCLAYAEEVLVERVRRSQLLGMASPALADPWFEPGRLLRDSISVGDARCHVRLEDAGTKLHLNRASEQELRRLMAALRVDDADADRAAQAIMDWRDLDDLRRARGAERREYLEFDALVLPSNGPFGSMIELRNVLGVTPEIYVSLTPHLTLKGSGRINLMSAPPEVLAAIPGMSDDLLVLIVRRRRSGLPVTDILSLTDQLDERSRETVRQNLPALMSRLVSGTHEVLITSEAWVSGAVMHAYAGAVAVRSGKSVFVVERVVR